MVDKSQHAIKKQTLQVSLYIPPKPEPPPKSADNMLLLKDLPEKFKENNLELYIDGITDLEYDEDEYTYNIKQYEGDTVVLVTLNTEAGSKGSLLTHTHTHTHTCARTHTRTHAHTHTQSYGEVRYVPHCKLPKYLLSLGYCIIRLVKIYISFFITDLDDIIDKISKKPFTKAGHYITAEKVPACTSVIIKNVPPDKCDEDTLDLYFSSKKKSGVDQYKSIKILANDTAVVDFEDEQSK